MRIRNHISAQCLACVVILTAGTAMADLITPTDVGGTMGTSFNRPETNAINNSGIGAPELGGYDTHAQNSADNWLSADNMTPGTMTYDLGAVYNITNMVLWNYDENNHLTNRGIYQFTVAYYDTTNGLISVTSTQTATRADVSSGRIQAQVFDLPDASNVNKIKLYIASNHGGGETYTGISELKFGGTYVSAWENYTPLELISPTGAVTTMGEWNPRELFHSWDTSGISPAAPPLWSTNTHGTAASDYMWESNNEQTGTVTYAFSNVLEVSAVALWNGNEVWTKCVRDFDIIFLDDSDTQISSVTGLVAKSGRDTYYLYELSPGCMFHGPLAQSAGAVAEVFSFTPVRDVKKVRLNIRSNYGATSVNISEIGIVGRVVGPAGTMVLIR